MSKAQKVGDPVVYSTRYSFIPYVVAKINPKSFTIKSQRSEHTLLVRRPLHEVNVLNEDFVWLDDGRVWLDPDAAKVEQDKQEAARLQKIEDDKAALVRKHAEDAAYLQGCFDAAYALANTLPLTSEETEEQAKERKARKRIGQNWLDCQEEIDEFARRIRLNPADRFEWAEGAMECAARHEIYSRMLHAVTRAENPISAVEAMKYTKEDLTKRLLQNSFRGNSSSSAHNAMMAARAKAASDMVGWNLLLDC